MVIALLIVLVLVQSCTLWILYDVAKAAKAALTTIANAVVAGGSHLT
jgi:hypothetical protein